MTALSVNLNKVAWLRNAREGGRPDILETAQTVIEAGVQGITVHPRPDQRHIRTNDVYALSEFLKTHHPTIEFNIEGNPLAEARDNGYPGFNDLIKAARPQQATLVPDSDGQLTSDHGWNFSNADQNRTVAAIISQYQELGARVSLFMDPVREQIAMAKAAGTDRIELYTGPYADLVELHGINHEHTRNSWEIYRNATHYAVELGLGVNAGHDLNLNNLSDFVSIGKIKEVSIGHALISDALEFGLAKTTRKYLDAISKGT